MFDYEKRLQYPIKIKNPDPAMAKFIISQYGGPHGEDKGPCGIFHRDTPCLMKNFRAALNDIGTEELSHFEMVGTIVHQLTRGLKESEIKNSPSCGLFHRHTAGVYPVAASGAPFSATTFASTGDTIADLTEDSRQSKKRV